MIPSARVLSVALLSVAPGSDLLEAQAPVALHGQRVTRLVIRSAAIVDGKEVPAGGVQWTIKGGFPTMGRP